MLIICWIICWVRARAGRAGPGQPGRPGRAGPGSVQCESRCAALKICKFSHLVS